MDIQDISYFECFKCHQKCLQTNSIILKLFLEKEVLIYFDDIFNDKCTASAPLLTNTNWAKLAPRSRAFLQFVGNRLGCGGAGARGHNQSITVIDTEVMRVQITCYVAMGAAAANSLWNEGLLTARYLVLGRYLQPPSHHYYPVSVIVMSCQARLLLLGESEDKWCPGHLSFSWDTGEVGLWGQPGIDPTYCVEYLLLITCCYTLYGIIKHTTKYVPYIPTVLYYTDCAKICFFSAFS